MTHLCNGRPRCCARYCETELPDADLIVVSNREPYVHEKRARPDPVARAGERPRFGAGANHAHLCRHLDRAWQRLRRYGNGRRQRSDRRAAIQSRLHAQARLADRGGIQGLLLRFRQRRPLAALPHRLHAAHLPGSGLGMLPGRQPQVRRGGAAGSQNRPTGHTCPGLSFRAAAAADPRETARKRSSSPSGTYPGRTPRYSASVRGAREILDGLLGSSILGFHIQLHCNNFIDSVDRFLESRIDREDASISYGGDATVVHPYPISIEWPEERRPLGAGRARARLPEVRPARRT